MANTLWVIATAIIIAVAIMLMASRALAEFVQRRPTVKMLALSFLILIGMTLIARKLTPFIGPSMTQGAVMRSWRSAAKKAACASGLAVPWRPGERRDCKPTLNAFHRVRRRAMSA
jgi:predicted tellurium resistance membrane protein TerC